MVMLEYTNESIQTDGVFSRRPVSIMSLKIFLTWGYGKGEGWDVTGWESGMDIYTLPNVK